MTCIQCPVSFFVVNAKYTLWKASDTPELPTREQTWISKAYCQFCTFGNRMLFQNSRISSRKYSIRGLGGYTLENFFFFLIRACLTIVSWLGARYSFQSVKNWLEYLWMASDSLYTNIKQSNMSQITVLLKSKRKMSLLSSFVPYINLWFKKFRYIKHMQ